MYLKSLITVCMHVFTYVCIYVCVYVCIYACMYVMCVCMYARMCVHACMYACMYINVCMFLFMYVCFFVFIYICFVFSIVGDIATICQTFIQSTRHTVCDSSNGHGFKLTCWRALTLMHKSPYHVPDVLNEGKVLAHCWS